MIKVLFIFTLALCSLLSGYARDVALVVGGGCHSTLRSEMAQETQGFQRAFSEKGWAVDALFGDDVNRGDVGSYSKGMFSKDNLIAYLNEEARDLKEGDRFMLNIVTHGLPASKGHFICLGNGEKLNIDDPEIHAALSAMKKNKVQMAFIDNSCYGGESINLFKEYGCTLSTQTDEFPSSAIAQNETFGIGMQMGMSTILRTMTNGSLEDVYLEGLRRYTDTSLLGVLTFPQISGDDAGNSVGKDAAFYAFWKDGTLDIDLDLNVLNPVDPTNNTVIECREGLVNNRIDEFIEHSHSIIRKLRMSLMQHGPDGKAVDALVSELQRIKSDIAHDDAALAHSQAEIAKRRNDLSLVANDISIALAAHPVPYAFRTPLSESDQEAWTRAGCSVSSDRSVLCPLTLDKTHFANSLFRPLNEKSLSIDEYIGVSKDIDDLYMSQRARDGASIVDCVSERMELHDQHGWGLISDSMRARADAITSAISKDEVRAKEIQSNRSKHVSRFTSTFNKLRAIDYESRRSMFNNKYIKACRQFTI